MKFSDAYLKKIKENIRYAFIGGVLTISVLNVIDFALLVKDRIKK
jgi:hypothetical protein